MSLFPPRFPHAEYAEDQPLAKTILTTHVMVRAVTTGSILGLSSLAAQGAIKKIRGGVAKGGVSEPTFSPRRLLRITGNYTLVTTGLLALALAGRMRGREDIEWQDRSWRLTAHRGQLETDDWTYAGWGAGLATATVAAARGSSAAAVAGGPVGFVGAAGVGGVLGTIGYLGWRYGVNGGKFAGDEE